jgi:hypothetical protein
MFRIFKSIAMQSMNICGAREGFFFEFAILNGIWKFGGILLLGRAHLSAARFLLFTAWDCQPVLHAALF